MLNIALTKGRTEQDVLPLLKQAGVDTVPIENKGRKLIFTDRDRYRTILAKGPDVLTYLNRGSVDIGIVGSDILTEQENDQPDMLDLQVSKCHFVLASTSAFNPDTPRRLIIASKYPHITQTYFDTIGTDVEIIKIEGSVELAPLIGMADAIVDIVETGTTLRENHLQVYNRLQDCSAHLVVNRLALKQKRAEVYQLITNLQKCIQAK
ncbi:ATP phosphoribosyltransferase [Lacticaseibacillus zhaodongensis]|uniref:ATP phosphoribosyltransferase n=1 Tax=Lacticaseibacillus zhaodongensis TaxID=2668065 RepID=UPI0012D3271E|nr:ATP phosphoribosyltransferase [Lacticaseibacillus zhaodongensis]